MNSREKRGIDGEVKKNKRGRTVIMCGYNKR
jgi:hypothetical protein